MFKENHKAVNTGAFFVEFFTRIPFRGGGGQDLRFVRTPLCKV